MGSRMLWYRHTDAHRTHQRSKGNNQQGYQTSGPHFRPHTSQATYLSASSLPFPSLSFPFLFFSLLPFPGFPSFPGIEGLKKKKRTISKAAWPFPCQTRQGGKAFRQVSLICAFPREPAV